MEMVMAWRNVWRNPRRTVLTILAIAFACLLLVFMLSLQFGTYEVMIDSVVKQQTGHLQILMEGYNETQEIQKVIGDPAGIRRILQETPGVRAYTFRAGGFALLSSDNRTCGGMVTGVDPAQEPRVSSTAHTIRRGCYLSPGDTNAAVIGALLAKKLKVDLGDELVVLGTGRDWSVAATVLVLTGIFSSGIDAYDRATVQMPLAGFQEVFAMEGAVHQAVVVCRDLGAVAGVRAAVSRRLAGLEEASLEKRARPVCKSWDELAPGVMQSIQMDLGGGVIFYAILVVVVAFSIMNTFVIAVFERTHEFCTLMAIGAKPWRLTRMLLYESLFLTACGIGMGMVAGCALTLWAQSSGIPLGEAEGMMRQYGIPSLIRPKLTLVSALAGPLVVFVITLLAALYPAARVHRLNPVDAMHTP